MANFTFPNYGLFNSTYYLQQNPDVATSWTGTPLQHYIQFGALEGRAPTAWFNADFYRASYTDLQSMNALQLFNHYCNFGFNEGRVPMLNFSNFNGARYLLDNPDVAAAGYTAGNAISHFVAYGEYEGRVAYAQNGVVINPVVNEGDLYTLTTGVDNIDGTQFNDTFDASQTNTLQNFDSLDGMGGTDTLYATINGNVAPAQLANMEVISATTTAGATLNLINGGQVTNVNNNGSTDALTVSNIAAGADLSVSNVVGVDTQFDYANVTGTQSADLTVDGVTASNVPVVPVITVEGVETINVTASGNDSEFVLTDLAANTLNFEGNANLVVDIDGTTGAVSLIDASTMTGDFEIVTGAQAPALGAVVSVLGGLGDDAIDINGLNKTSTYTVTLGAGDDVVLDDTVSLTSTIAGGLGEDTLETTAANAATLSATAPTTYNITGMDVLTIDQMVGAQNVRTQNIDTSIDTVNVAGSAAVATSTLTMGAGSAFVNLTAALGKASTLVVADTGTAITDTVTIADGDGANTDIFGGANLTSTGYENVVIDVSNGVWTDTSQDIGTLTVTADAASAPVSVTLSGDNDVSIAAFSTNSTGLTTINASGIAAGTDSPMFILGGTALGAGGTQSIVGTIGNDQITVGAFASTIVASAGNDTVTGSTGNDSIDGGTGNDSLVSGGGNDTIRGGEGNDVVNVGATITADDVLDGGVGTNTLAYSQQVIAAYAGATNFQTLRMDTGVVSQNVALFTGSTFSEVELNHDGKFNISGLADGVTLTALANTNSITATHTTDTTSNTLTVAGLTGVAANVALASVVANDTDTLTITGGDVVAGKLLTIASLEATDVDAITISGAQDTKVTLNGAEFGTTARTVTVNAAAATGTVEFNAANQADTGVALTMTGSATAANTLTGGAGNDVITGGAAADSLVGGAGNDTINAGTGTIADAITGGSGADNMTGGAGVDTYTQAVTDSVLSTAQSTAAGVNIAATQTITFGNSVDVITDFLAGTGGDVINTVGSGAAITAIGVANNALVLDKNYFMSGSYNTLTGVFTIAADGTGADTLIMSTVNGTAATQNWATNQDAIVLVGVDSDNLVAANFA